MVFPLIPPLAIAGATALLAHQVIRNYRFLDEAADENSAAKLTLEVMENELKAARNAARESLSTGGGKRWPISRPASRPPRRISSTKSAGG